MFWALRFLHILFLQALVDLNPVPNPGAALTILTFDQLMTQRLLTEYVSNSLPSCEGEGCRGTTTPAGAEAWQQLLTGLPANRGNPPPMSGNTPIIPSPSTCVQKRSFKRACRRAISKGYADYHGRRYQLEDFPAHLVRSLRPPAKDKVMPLASQHRRDRSASRISTLFWNAGGMSQSTFLELRHWLRSNPVDVAIIAETKWSFTSTWEDAEWAYLHTATDQRRSGGLLVMVARSLAHPDQLGLDVVLPGRLIHVRVHGDSRSFDILAVYQYVNYRNPTSTKNRDQFWNMLDDCIRRLPSRNNFLCVGDFNCDLQQQAPWVGSTTFSWRGQYIAGSHHHDHHRFQDLLRVHGLTSLNSWGSSGATFVHGNFASRIDHFLMRLISCDGQAKQVQYLTHADFVPGTQSHHIPILCTIRKHHIRYQRYGQPATCSPAQRNQCRLASLEETEHWNQLRNQVILAVTLDLPEASPEETIARIHQNVSAAFHELFPHARVRFPCTDLTQFHQHTEDKWFHKRILRDIRLQPGPLKRRVLQAWFHQCRFAVLQRRQQRSARQAKQDRFQLLCQEVDEAASRHDLHRMYAIINKFSPKQPQARARLKGPDGRMADQYLAHSMTVAFVQEMWTGPERLPQYSESAPGVPFTLAELTADLIRLNLHKAVAPPFLPAVIWKSAPAQVAAALYRCLQDWWSCSPPFIPQTWKDSWLRFIPKPGKPNTHPSQMRPISLMEPLGKLVMGLLARQLQIFLHPHLKCYPHFGFMPQRSTLDAIQRVASHSRDIRALVGSQKRTVIQQMTHAPKLIICGGLSLFLDMTRAFDCANRTVLFDHLRDLDTPLHLLQLVSSWHEQTQYCVQFQQQHSVVQVGKGLRQGCKIAPQLWVIYMDKFLTMLEPLTGSAWIAACLTIYADDVHVGCRFTSGIEFQVHLRNLGFVLDVLEQLDLQLSYQKSFILMRYAGTNPRPTLKGLIRRQGLEHCLLVQRLHGQPTALPLRKKGSYLGAIITYSDLESQSWQHRKRAAWIAFNRLRNWLSNRSIAIRPRLHLWKQSVFTVLTYSLMATQVTISILHDFQAVVYRMIRILIGDHPYRTHHSHQQVFQQFHLSHPLDMLLDLATALHRRIRRRDQDLAPNDFLHRIDWTSLESTQHLIACIRASVVEVPISLEPSGEVLTQVPLTCDYCDFVTTSISNYRRHCTIHHGVRIYRTAAVHPASVAYRGAPQCRHCFQVFTTWKNFFVHVQRACCQVPSTMATGSSAPLTSDVDRGPAVPMPMHSELASRHFHILTQTFWPELQPVIFRAAWHQIPRHAGMLEYLMHHCAICGLWCDRFQELHGHLRQQHSEQVQGCVAKGVQISQLLEVSSPCRLCQRPFSRVHSCPVTLQLGMLTIQMRPEAERSAMACTCDICALPFQDLGQLYGHLTNTHGLTLNDWCPSRDAHQGGDGCRHCGQIFESRSGLRRHITEGRCGSFDPTATPHSINATDKWGSWLQTGSFAPHHLTASMRLQLTNTCQFCGLTYSRTGDLVSHLLQSHGDLWTSSQPWLRFLLQAVMSRYGCLCNPQCNDLGVTHICTLHRQVAMMIHSQDNQLFVPTQFLRQDVEQTFMLLQDDALQQKLMCTLLERDFERLWQDEEILQGLRQRCLTCGGHYTTAILLHHLLVQHPQVCAWAAQFLFQLHHMLQAIQSNDYSCSLCKQVFNVPVASEDAMTPDRCHLQFQHFATNCPVVLQLGVLLHPLHGRGDGSQRPGADGWAASVGSSPAGSQKTYGWKRRSPAQTAQIRLDRRTTGRPSSGSGHVRNAAPHGSADPESRENSCSFSYARTASLCSPKTVQRASSRSSRRRRSIGRSRLRSTWRT